MTVRRWRDAASGKMFEEVEPVPAPPQEDFRRSGDGLRRKLSALLGRTANPFEDEEARAAAKAAEAEQEAAEAEADALRPQRSAEDLQRAYEQGHSVALTLAAQGSNRRDAAAEVDADGYAATFDDRIHAMNADALRLDAMPHMLKHGGTVVPDSQRRGADGVLASGGSAVQSEYIASILKDAGIVARDGQMRGQEAATEASAGAGHAWTHGAHKQPTAVHNQPRNAQMGEKGGSSASVAAPLADSAVRKVLAEFLNRALAREASSVSSATASAPASSSASKIATDHAPAKLRTQTDAALAPSRSKSSAVAYLSTKPELLGRALMQALAEMAPAWSDKRREHLPPSKLKKIEERLGKAVLARADLSALVHEGPQRAEASTDDRVREVVLNTLAIKLADALDAHADARVGEEYALAGLTRPAQSSAAKPEAEDAAARVATARVLLGLMLSSDADFSASPDRHGAKDLLYVGHTWGEELKRLARLASADSEGGALYYIDQHRVREVEERMMLALFDGLRVSERISQAMLASTSVEAPAQKSASALSAEDRTIVARLLALNAMSADGVGAPTARLLSSTDAAPRLGHELSREMVGRNEAIAETAVPEALLRAWVLEGPNPARGNELDRALSSQRDAAAVAQPINQQRDIQQALEAAAAVLKGRASVRASIQDDGVARSTSPRRTVTETLRVEARRK